MARRNGLFLRSEFFTVHKMCDYSFRIGLTLEEKEEDDDVEISHAFKTRSFILFFPSEKF